MASITFSKTLSTSSTSTTVYSDWVNLYSDSFAGRAYCTVNYSKTGGYYTVGPIYFEVRSTTDSTITWSVTIDSASVYSTSNFKNANFSNKIEYPNTMAMGRVGTGGKVAVKYGSYNSSVDTSTIAFNSWKSASVVLKSKVYISNTDYSTVYTHEVNTTIWAVFSCYGSKCTVSFLKEDGTKYTSKTGSLGTTVSVPAGYMKTSNDDKKSGQYTITYDSRGGTEINPKNLNWSWAQSVTYTFSSWGGYRAGDTYTFSKESDSLTAIFTENRGEKKWKYPTLGTLPAVYKIGNNRTNVWYYPNDQVASSSDTITSSTTLHVEWDPKMYKISFNLNGGKMPEEYGKISDYTVEKTWGVTSSKTPPFTPLRVGYVFTGWQDQAGSTTLFGVDAYINNDNAYNKENTPQTNKNIVLYAKWKEDPNTLEFRYFIGNTKVQEYETYYITNTSAKKYAPKISLGGDYVFLGWCIQMPYNYGWNGGGESDKQGYHGIYTDPTAVPGKSGGIDNTPQYPVSDDISKLVNLDDWGWSKEVKDGDTVLSPKGSKNTMKQIYYGVWTKTGKYVKVNNTWTKVNSAYIKIDGEWVAITDIWTCSRPAIYEGDQLIQTSLWNHEI